MAEEPNPQLAGDEDLERARAFWQENGRPIVAGVLLGIFSIGGWNGWQYWQKSEGESASTLYQNLVSGEIGPAAAASIAGDLMGDYSGSPYAANAALVMAKMSVEAKDYAEARRYLEWVADNAGEEALVHIARLRLAQVAMAENRPDEALQTLQQGGAVAADGPFAARYQELIGDAEEALGNHEAARKAWETSRGLLESGSSSARLVQLKLDNLGKL